jgi:MarR-like DNA-binding transcriptional regulator SgrR of sgrS sRNA
VDRQLIQRAVLVLAALAVGSAAAKGRPSYGGSVAIALPGARVVVDSLDPSPSAREIAALVYDTLFVWTPAGAAPSLALAVETIGDGKRAVVQLRTDVRFHDGRFLRASDVAAALEHAIASPSGWMLGPIRSARAIADDRVALELSREAPDLTMLLATPAARIARREDGVGTGPFKIETRSATELALRAHEHAFAGRPFLDALKLKVIGGRIEQAAALDSGAVAAAWFRTSKATRAPQEVWQRTDEFAGPIAITVGLALGARLEGFRDALSAAIDREKLRRLAIREPAVAAWSAAPAALGGIVAARPARAPDSKPRTNAVLLVDAETPADREIAERLVADVAQIGLELSVENAPAGTFVERLRSRRFDVALITTVAPLPHAGLAELALLAAIDPSAARATLTRGAATAGAVQLAQLPLIVLAHRAQRVFASSKLAGIVVDHAGSVAWPDVFMRGAR